MNHGWGAASSQINGPRRGWRSRPVQRSTAWHSSPQRRLLLVSLGSGDGQDRWGRVDLGFGSVEVSGLRCPGTSDCFLVSRTPIPACLSVPWICNMLSRANLRLPLGHSVSLFASLFPSHCLFFSLCFAPSPSDTSTSLSPSPLLSFLLFGLRSSD